MDKEGMVQVDDFVTEFVVTDGSSRLTREEKNEILAMVKQHLKDEQERCRQRDKDTGLRDRAYQAEGPGGNGA